ncbi:tRNA (N(6)-L-threonylcarbamoyladenosine(37)-C(2))-methylthiotransferase MtaB [Yanshouia hominis]|uniref:tRNA (N(6)-L-threonylcarbamoyladenosine(37)-C(2))-methylthiotransferase MtaB n=1 Tax=Yanshouia hominis TaxID=2763673 RepID=A0ABR7NGX8_9FIRM|nr:tRNA (N(6)-L-threonylcarbamoyladenosine(37)-C(2))-methylthiotransferase MtaB [Yanshouia hominis]MBC8575651.1 tRNA (N(6)-L-threonylcarbamoyladenosine(37)-C(2))-methylthiotransferase MtaB [Yanshouia hominis]
MRVRFLSLGCRVNQYEAQALEGLFSQNGFTVVLDGEADVFVINSCTVTSAADRKSRQAVRRVRREHPGAVVVLTGCLPQAAPDAARALPEADIVTGSLDRAGLVGKVQSFLRDGERRVSIPAFSPGEAFEPLEIGRFDESFQRAYLKVEDGCDRFCSYCAIPLARGPVRSRPPGEITAEVRRLVRAGYREIVLTGINLSRYGSGWGSSLAEAAAACEEVPGDFRIRLGSVEPDLLSPADWDALAAFPRLCPQFHLALQSGCDATLRRMNRHYTARQYLETVEGIRGRFSNPSVTTDLIAGFPGETEAEFEECCRTVEAAGLLRGHVFEYSPRAGTAAAALPDQVLPAVKKERAKALARLCRESGRAFAQTQVGRTARVLLEATGGGYTDNYLYVQVFPPGQVPHGAGGWIDVRLDRVVEDGCHGIPINTDCKTEKENEDGGISCFH